MMKTVPFLKKEEECPRPQKKRKSVPVPQKNDEKMLSSSDNIFLHF